MTRRTTQKLPGGLVLGFSLAISGVGLLLMELVSTTSSWTVLLPGMLVAGFGVGLANPAIAHIALAVVAPQRSGMASGISNTFRIGGLATGVAGLGALLQHGIATQMPNAGKATVNAVAAAGVHAPGVPPALATSAFVHGLHLVIAAGGLLVLAGSRRRLHADRRRKPAPGTGRTAAPNAGDFELRPDQGESTADEHGRGNGPPCKAGAEAAAFEHGRPRNRVRA